eukprot:6214566-Pleurochrysis_carterae.AAC.2
MQTAQTRTTGCKPAQICKSTRQRRQWGVCSETRASFSPRARPCPYGTSAACRFPLIESAAWLRTGDAREELARHIE